MRDARFEEKGGEFACVSWCENSHDPVVWSLLCDRATVAPHSRAISRMVQGKERSAMRGYGLVPQRGKVEDGCRFGAAHQDRATAL